jgi:2-haloacid dehalogenase
MALDRRNFLTLAAGTLTAAAWLSSPTAQGATEARVKAVAFDAFPIFDPRPVFGLAETLFPGRGAELSNAWRTRQFEYQWLRALSGHYADFWQTTEDGLVFAAKLLQLELTPAKRTQLMQAYLELKAWPDVLPALGALKAAGVRLALLSNMTAKMLRADRIRTYKPDPRAYQLAIEAFKLERHEILFVAFAGWDAAGAKRFGYPTFWVNRLNLPGEELGVAPDATGRGLADLVSFAKSPG